jgi:hypothetical protein
MEPLDDPELDALLRQWQAPAVPDSLARRIRVARRGSWWKWLLTGSIRIPVPVAVLLACILLVMLAMKNEVARQPKHSEFQPVKRLEPRIIRSSYEINN